MSHYNNTLGVVVANGALSTIYSTAAAPMIKTVIRDVKGYMTTAQESLGQRRLPVGYSASNSRLMLKTTFDYFTAGGEGEGVDFFCVSTLTRTNLHPLCMLTCRGQYANFNWCGESTMHISGYDAEVSASLDPSVMGNSTADTELTSYQPSQTHRFPSSSRSTAATSAPQEAAFSKRPRPSTLPR